MASPSFGRHKESMNRVKCVRVAGNMNSERLDKNVNIYLRGRNGETGFQNNAGRGVKMIDWDSRQWL